MLRRLRSRLASALLAPWFAFVMADPVPMHGCPMHEALAGHQPVAIQHGAIQHGAIQGVAHGTPLGADHAVHQAGHDGVRHEAAPNSAQDGDPAGGHAPVSGHSCTCLGQCCVASVAPLPAAAVAPPAATPLRRTAPVAPAAYALPPQVRRAHERPFANGPPVSAAA